MFTTDWVNMLIIFVISFMLLSLMSLMAFVFWKDLKFFVIKLYGNILQKINIIHQKYGILWKIFNRIRGNELSYSIDIIFQLFCRFYEQNKNDIINWGYDNNYFPNNWEDLSDLYYWIIKTRVDNYNKIKNIINNNGYIEYCNAVYTKFKFKINKYGELIFIPIHHSNDYKFNFEMTILKLQNALYKLDTEKCIWIIDRRKFFGF